MSWRIVVIRNRAKLDLKFNDLVIRGMETMRIHLGEISTILIEHTGVSLTAALLVECNKRKIKVIFCDEKRNPSFETLPYYGSHDTSLKVKTQLDWSQDMKNLVWTEIVREKITKQRALLIREQRSEASLLSRYLQQLEYQDATNREGHAAKVYFNALFGKGFTRANDHPINAALNYGYAILLSAFNREVVSAGYITQLGLFHDNRFNLFNLSCDLMEPFRPLVDGLVCTMDTTQFGSQEKMMLVDLLNGDVHVQGKTHVLNHAIKLYCKSVFDSLDKQDISNLQFCEYEL